jgi:hypothetical protein
MTDSRAALAEYFAPTDYDDEPQYRVDEPQQLADFLAERGVLLVTEAAIPAALRRRAGVQPGFAVEYSANDWLNIEAEESSAEDVAAAIFAALSAEVTE